MFPQMRVDRSTGSLLRCLIRATPTALYGAARVPETSFECLLYVPKEENNNNPPTHPMLCEG